MVKCKIIEQNIFEGKSNICVLFLLYRLYSCFKGWEIIAHGITSFFRNMICVNISTI